MNALKDFSDTVVYTGYSQGAEAFKGDLYFYSVDHDLRGKLVVAHTRTGEYWQLLSAYKRRRGVYGRYACQYAAPFIHY